MYLPCIGLKPPPPSYGQCFLTVPILVYIMKGGLEKKLKKNIDIGLF